MHKMQTPPIKPRACSVLYQTVELLVWSWVLHEWELQLWESGVETKPEFGMVSLLSHPLCKSTWEGLVILPPSLICENFSWFHGNLGKHLSQLVILGNISSVCRMPISLSGFPQMPFWLVLKCAPLIVYAVRLEAFGIWTKKSMRITIASGRNRLK